jgi:leucyl aminopeptidase
MNTTLPTVKWHPPGITEKAVDSCDHVILLIARDDKALRGVPHSETIQARLRRASRNLKDVDTFTFDLPNKRGTRVTLVSVKTDAATFERLTLARQVAGLQTADKARSVTIMTAGLDDAVAQHALETTVAALVAATLSLPTFKREKDKSPGLREIVVPSNGKPAWLARTLAEARGNHLARALTVLPPNELTPGSYRKRVERLAKENKWQARFFDMKKLKALGAGAFLAVAQGSPEPDAGILHLQYRPKKITKGKNNRPALALVGKGICFDTGGTNLKPARYMHGMHEDMEGSAVALGTLLALSELKVDFAVDCWLALAQNHIGPKAYRQNEVITTLNGTTIEIVHTDAEGRMVLSDTLTLASREKPKLIIDYATLTGSCIGALGTKMSGVFTNKPEWIGTLIKSGEDSGERVWPFPLPNDYQDQLKSKIADTKQCTLDSEADHILAALFLKKFIENDPAWIHVDLSAGNHKGGLGHIPTDATGFGVRFTLDLLLNTKVLREAA